MEWRDEGILLWVRRHGESNAIVEALTENNGRHAGLVRGGASKSQAATLQPGAQLSLEWKARLAEHLGTYKVDLIQARAGAIMAGRDTLACLNCVSAMLVQYLPEREPNPEVYRQTYVLMNRLGTQDPGWPFAYAIWELNLLEALGFGLDLRRCASTGQSENLVYVSPRSGRAVCRAAGGPFADRMLPLPQFLIRRGNPTIGDVREALRLTSYFLENWVCPAFEIEKLPAARARLIKALDHIRDAVQTDPPDDDLNATEKAWLRQAE